MAVAAGRKSFELLTDIAEINFPNYIRTVAAAHESELREPGQRREVDRKLKVSLDQVRGTTHERGHKPPIQLLARAHPVCVPHPSCSPFGQMEAEMHASLHGTARLSTFFVKIRRYTQV
jgi:hypothetical protein